MTLLDKEAVMLRLAFEAAARGAGPDSVDAAAVTRAVEQLYPTEAAKLVTALDILTGVARRVASGQLGSMVDERPNDVDIERQYAADRVSKYLGQHDLLHGEDLSGDRITAIAHTEHAPLNASDLRLLVQAAPSLPPKWSEMLTGDSTARADAESLAITNARQNARVSFYRKKLDDLGYTLSTKDREELAAYEEEAANA